VNASAPPVGGGPEGRSTTIGTAGAPPRSAERASNRRLSAVCTGADLTAMIVGSRGMAGRLEDRSATIG